MKIGEVRHSLPAAIAAGAILLNTGCDSPPKPMLDENGLPRPQYTVASKNTHIPFTPTRVDRTPFVDRTSPDEFLRYFDTYLDPRLATQHHDLASALIWLRIGVPISLYKTTADLYGQPHGYHILNQSGNILNAQIYDRSPSSKIVCFKGLFNSDRQLIEQRSSQTPQVIPDERLREYSQLLLRDKNLPIQGRVYSADVNEGEEPLQTFAGVTSLSNGTEVILNANSRGEVNTCIVEH